jgi:hypothetical protein
VKIKSDTDLHVGTTWGASIFLKAGEEREVGDDLGYQALQQGAVEVRDAPKKPATKKRGRASKRARTEEGHFVADDPSTPDVNEAYKTE